MNPPSSHNFRTQTKSFPKDTTRQASSQTKTFHNTSHQSPFTASFRPSFPLNHFTTPITNQPLPNTQNPLIFRPSLPQNSSPASSSHIQTNHLSSSFQPAIRPSFLYDMRQNSSSSSSSLQASVRPNVHHNSSSSSSSSRSQLLQSQPTVHEPTLNQSSSSNSLLKNLSPGVEMSLADQYEKNLESEVEIIGYKKMIARQVYKLNAGEKVLVHLNQNSQLIKKSGSLCSKFMTLLLQEPNLCPPDAKDWKELKDDYAVMLIAELRIIHLLKEMIFFVHCTITCFNYPCNSLYRQLWQWRFCIPQGETVDMVLSSMFSTKRRGLKYRLKESLFEQAADKINEANGINRLDAQENTYTDDELLAALDLLEPPKNFQEHLWRVYKSNLRKLNAKKLSLCGKKARKDQVHTHTTGVVSFARTKDIYVIANREISSKVKELVGPEGIVEDAVVAQIAREVFNNLLGDEPHCYGPGVTKSHISKFWCDLRRMRGETLADENRFLTENMDNKSKELVSCKAQLATQNKNVESYRMQVETQDLKIHNLEKTLNEVYGMLKLFPVLPHIDNESSTVAGTCNKQPSSSTSPSPFMDEDHYSPVMDDPSFGY